MIARNRSAGAVDDGAGEDRPGLDVNADIGGARDRAAVCNAAQKACDVDVNPCNAR